MNILIPLAGDGRRFTDRGFKTPKPLIELLGKPMIQHSIESLNLDGNYIFIIRSHHNIDNKLTNLLKTIKPSCVVIEVDVLTRGCTDTCLRAKEYINNDMPLIITNCDQILSWNSVIFQNHLLLNQDLDGYVMTYKSSNEQNSFVKLDNDNNAIEFAEKKVISNHALVGFHYWKHGADFVWSAEELINRNIRMNNEYYISITYNLLIEVGKKIGIYPLEDTENYYSVGTPDDMFKYLDEQHNIGFKTMDMSIMHRGWFIGNFLPSAYKTEDFEVGFLKHHKDEKWAVHFHKKATEINYLVKGKMKLNHKILNKGDIFIFDKGEIACPVFLEDCEILCIKVPSFIGDKYEI